MLTVFAYPQLLVTIDAYGADNCGNICDHFCLNDTFVCACYHGYYLDADNVTCKGNIFFHVL